MFQPTLPLRGATEFLADIAERERVSTHAPLAGSDVVHLEGRVDAEVSTHAPLAGSDLEREAVVDAD